MPEHRCVNDYTQKEITQLPRDKYLILFVQDIKWKVAWWLPGAMRGGSEELVFIGYRISV